MRRFRLRRRRAIAAALLPLGAVLATQAPATAAPSTPAGGQAQIDASRHSVAIGDEIALRGSFPGARRAPLEIRYRAKGSGTWHTVARQRTANNGRYDVRVKPRRSGFWRAELRAGPEPQAAPATSLDTDTASEKVSVRSRTTARVHGRRAMVGDQVEVTGTVTPAGARRRVSVQIGGEQLSGHAGRDGSFEIEWEVPRTGTFGVRVSARSNSDATGSHDAAGRVSVYRPAAASWYGPGLYGNALACGGTLTPSTLGVANRSLPCGTKVHLRYGDRSITVPVVDRGPYAGNREYDLTSATRDALGFPDVGTVLTTR